MSRSAEVIMHLLLPIAVIGFAFVVVLGARSFVRDLLALTKYRPPSVFDGLREDDQESEDWNRRGTSPYAVDAQASRTVVADIIEAIEVQHRSHYRTQRPSLLSLRAAAATTLADSSCNDRAEV
jgi:hypothetical protein